ncbi:MAG: sulfatase-like hydrolase/transferase [Anaerolineae bacterium]|nr:sulfatase-like hydrolase/transferase [Anaerolineae bacterium]
MPDRPNILVVMTDQQKATASHLYGNTFCDTPAMARLADEGVRFEHAFTPHPLCVPARVSLWTARFPHSHGARRNETFMPARATHAFQIWRGEGYHCGLIGKNHCFERPADLDLFDTWCEISHGGLPKDAQTKGMPWVRPLDGIHAAHTLRRSLRPQNARFAYGTSDLPIEDHSTDLIAKQTVRFLEQHRHDPFALWVSFPDPHEPWVVPERYAAMFPRDRITLPPWPEDKFSPHSNAPERNRVLHHLLGIENDAIEDVYGLLGVYYGMVRFIDDALGQIIGALDELRLREKTIVVFCSDHGDFMGEHGMQCKGGVFYDCLTRIPLIISWSGQIPAGQRDDSMVNLVDVVPTLLQLQGLEVPRSMTGQPLPTVTTAPPREATFSEYGAGGPPFRLADLEALPRPFGRKTLIQSLQWREAEGRRKMVRTREWKYVHDPMGDCDELYDLANDPWELENTIDNPDHGEVIADMRLRLLDWSIRSEDSSPVPLPGRKAYTLG